MTGIVGAEGVGDTDNWSLQRLIGVAHGLDKGLAQEQREALVAVTRQPFAHTLFHRES